VKIHVLVTPVRFGTVEGLGFLGIRIPQTLGAALRPPWVAHGSCTFDSGRSAVGLRARRFSANLMGLVFRRRWDRGTRKSLLRRTRNEMLSDFA